MVNIDAYDLQFCNGTSSVLSSWSCKEIDSAVSVYPDIAVNSNGIYIFYQTATDSTADVVKANSSNRGQTFSIRQQVPSQSSSSYGSIAESRFPTWNRLQDTLHYVYTSSSDTYYSSISIPYTPSKGLINTTIGAEPFYTNGTNPKVISLLNGESQLITYWVNATGIPDSYEFFAYANLVDNTSIRTESSHWFVTIQ